MSDRRVRRRTVFSATVACLLVAACGSVSPYGVDPSLREAANHFAVALSQSDQKGLSQMNGSRDASGLASLLASYGGRSTIPVAYNSTDRGMASVELEVTCSSGNLTVWQRFTYVTGSWRPDLGVNRAQVGGTIPPAGAPPSVLPSPAPQPVCS
jgi:hypothetical protein